jgi:hypothetical protein
MKNEDTNPNDAKLGALLRESRPAPSLRPHFQQGVWRRIEDAEAPASAPGWLEALASFILKPRFAFGFALVLIAAGSLFGVLQGQRNLHDSAQARYLASVAPNSLR